MSWTITGTQKFKGVLDEIDGAVAAFSLSELTFLRGGPVVRIRRASDNAEQDFTAAQITDGTLTAFLGGGNGFVQTWYDQSVNGRHGRQGLTAQQPQYLSSPDRLVIASARRLQATLPATTGTMIIATNDGTAAYGVTIPSGGYLIGRNAGDFFPGSTLIGQLLFDRELDLQEIEDLRQFYIGKGAGDNYGSVTNFAEYWRGRAEITDFPLLDTSSGTVFRDTWRDCTSLTSFPALNFNSAGQFLGTWRNCTSLTSFPANVFDNCLAINYSLAWQSNALTPQSIENILVSINTSNTSGFTITLSGGTNAGKSTWTQAANDAYDALIARGWNIQFNA